MANAEKLAPRTVVILGIPFNDVSFADAVEWTRQRILSRRPAYIATANMDFITQAWRDPELQRILLEADLVVADGIPIVWLSRLLGTALKGRVTGSDLVPMLAELGAREGFSLFCLGGAPGVAEKAAATLVGRYPGLRIAGCHSPPKADILAMDNEDILARLAAAAPDIVLVAFGAPKQEKWVNLHIRQWRVPVAMGVGGSLDFLAGAQKRAPRFVQKLALEWLWRMLSDPRRLVKRYAANVAFLAGVAFRLLVLRYARVAAGNRDGVTAADVEVMERLNAKRLVFPPAPDAAQLDEFRAMCEAEARRRVLVMDMTGRTWLNSGELGVLLDLSRISRAAGRRVYVLAPHPRVARLLRFIRLDKYFSVAETAGEVIHGLRDRRSTAINGGVGLDAERRLVLVLPAELTAGTLEPFRGLFDRTWKEADARGGPGGVWIDATALDFIDSAGLGFLAGVRRKVDGLGAEFRCFGFRDGALRTLKLARMESLVTGVAPARTAAPPG